MRIAILGCGAMGTILGAYLNKNGCPVDMIDSYEAHVNALNERGAHIVDHVDFTVPVKALLPEQMEGIYDLVFLFTKQTANPVVLPKLLPYLGPNSTVCTLQNGVPEPYIAEYVGQERTVGGSVLWGATFVGPGTSAQTMSLDGWNKLFEIGETDGQVGDRIKMVQEVLNHMGPTKITDRLMDSRWAKLILNACGSGMSAACGCPFGDLLDNPRAHACMSYLGHEVTLCAHAAGFTVGPLYEENIPLGTPEQFAKSQNIFYLSYNHQRGAKASMLQDLECGRITEVSMINGYVCQIGDIYGIDTPYNDAVVRIIKKIESGQLSLSMDNLQYFPILSY